MSASWSRCSHPHWIWYIERHSGPDKFLAPLFDSVKAGEVRAPQLAQIDVFLLFLSPTLTF